MRFFPALAGTIMLLCGFAAQAQPAGGRLWSAAVGGTVGIPPAIGADGRIYVGSSGGLTVLEPNGTVVTRIPSVGALTVPPMIGADGTIYCLSSPTHALAAVTPAGVQLWKLALTGTVDAGPALGSDSIYLGVGNDFRSISLSGTNRWSFPVGIATRGAPVIGTDGTIYFTSYNRTLYALTPLGSLRWSTNLPGLADGLAVGGDGRIYAACNSERGGVSQLVSVKPDGSVAWSYNPVTSSLIGIPSLAPDGTIYVPASDRYLHAVNANGTRKWRYLASGQLDSPIVTGDGSIYLGATDGLMAIGPNGNLLWKTNLQADVRVTPALGVGGAVLVGTRNANFLIAVAGLNGPAPSPWPLSRHDYRNTANAGLGLPTLVNVIQPTNNTTVPQGTNVMVRVGTLGGSLAVTNLELFAGALKLATLTVQNNEYSWTNPPPGLNELRAVVTDAAGVMTTSAPVALIVQTRIEVALTAPTNGARVLPPDALLMSASAEGLDAAIVRVEFYLDGGKVGEALSAPYTYSLSAPPSGNHSVRARAVDALGGFRDSAETQINVFAEGDLVAFPDAYTILEDNIFQLDAPGVLANDVSISTLPVTVELVSSTALSGSFLLRSDGSIYFTPPPNFNGPVNFTYRLHRGTAPDEKTSTASGQINVTPVNDPPTLFTQNVLFTAQDHDTDVEIQAYDADGSSDPLSVRIITPPRHGGIFLWGGLRMHYTPTPRYIGPDQLEFVVTDSSGADSPAGWLNITVFPVLHQPTARPERYQTAADIPLVVPAAQGVLANDTDRDGDPLTAVRQDGPQHGTLTLAADGSFRYVPAADFNGRDGFSYRADDGWYYDSFEFASYAVVDLLVGNERWLRHSPGISGPTAGANQGPRVAALIARGSDVFAGGSFTNIGGVAARGIARWDGTNWYALGDAVGGDIRALAFGPDGSLYIGGQLLAPDGTVSTNHVARWDGAAWHELEGSVARQVNALAVDPQGHLFMGGDTVFPASGKATGLAMWDGTQWSLVGNKVLNSVVFALSQSGSDLYVGGSFDRVGTQDIESIARWDGTNWYGLGPGIPSVRHGFYVSALAVRGPEVIAAGNFETAGTNPARNLARWDGSSWSSLATTMQLQNQFSEVFALAWSGEALYVGGAFDTIDGVISPGVMRQEGGRWHALGSGLGGIDSRVYALLPMPRQLLVGGAFTEAGGEPSPGIARWFTEMQAAWTVHLENGRVQLSLPLPDGLHVQVEGSLDLNLWAPLGTVTSADGRAVYSEPAEAGTSAAYYRARLVP